ncbi:electron transfer flavoprotein subunit alpha/FixB family protein [Nocardioides sp.]|uniref:electron transfer flavoprotein subunit alpha/FixB family protein n=1 Tax=Nocardioides sp. TaxID=35761 RepID=UPI002611D046|nr:electron transfer flavoprotein subunit alpha/FixB family protein [Nocardioides sp.]MCW2736845.1 electron transfer flavoprotein subunit alpha [Nocardioides sp.]
MNAILVVAEQLDGELTEATKELVTAARTIGGRVVVGIIEPGLEEAAALMDGVDLVVRVDGGSGTGDFDHEQRAHSVRVLIDHVSPDTVLLAWSIRSASYAPAVAEELDAAYVADAISLARGDDGTLVAVRSMYAGKVHAELELASGVPAIVLVRPGVWAGAGDAGSAAAVETLEVPRVGESRVRHREYVLPAPGVDLTQADVIFAIGRGVGAEENIALFSELAQSMGVLLGSSRPLVDVGWLPSAHQVGQTGVTVKPKVYVAFGISGALQHVAGMKDSKMVVAVNTDPTAPIFGIADVGYNADILEVAACMRELV